MTMAGEQDLCAAVDWLVRHEAAALSAAERQEFEQWLGQDNRHRCAWDRVNGALAAPLTTVRNLQAQAEGVHVQAAMQALFRTRRRRVLRGALAMGGVAAAASLVADRLTPLAQVLADLRTGTGERRAFRLADGSTVLLDARSAVDVRYLSGVPQLQHRAGALIATRAHAGAGPLEIRTRDGLARLESGRMMSRVHSDRTEVVAMEHSLSLQPRALQSVILGAGEGASFSASRMAPLHGNPLHRAAWQQGMLAVDDWSLAEVAQALQAYFPGFIRVSPAVAELRVFGIFRLEVDELLNTLAQILPVQVRRLGPLISIDTKGVR